MRSWTPQALVACNADNPFAVAPGSATGRRAGRTSYVLCHRPKSLDWRLRAGAPHPAQRAPDAAFEEVLAILNQIVQLA